MTPDVEVSRMFTLPAAVAASQTIGLIGSLVVVTVVCFLEVTR